MDGDLESFCHVRVRCQVEAATKQQSRMELPNIPNLASSEATHDVRHDADMFNIVLPLPCEDTTVSHHMTKYFSGSIPKPWWAVPSLARTNHFIVHDWEVPLTQS